MAHLDSDTRDAANVLQALTTAVRTAGERAHRFFRRGRATTARISYKRGGSPVTSADLEANNFLRETLTRSFPQAAWLSEESDDSSDRRSKSDVLIIDPIDGTRAFAAGDGRWAVCAAYVRNGRPIAGVVYAPADQELYQASLGAGAWFNGVKIAPGSQSARGEVSGPADMVQPIAKILGQEAGPKTPSLALRFAAVSRGAFVAAVASPMAYDWDIAAADIILSESGCALTEIDGLARDYNKDAIRHAALFAASDAVLPSLLAAARAASAGCERT